MLISAEALDLFNPYHDAQGRFTSKAHAVSSDRIGHEITWDHWPEGVLTADMWAWGEYLRKIYGVEVPTMDVRIVGSPERSIGDVLTEFVYNLPIMGAYISKAFGPGSGMDLNVSIYRDKESLEGYFRDMDDPPAAWAGGLGLIGFGPKVMANMYVCMAQAMSSVFHELLHHVIIVGGEAHIGIKVNRHSFPESLENWTDVRVFEGINEVMAMAITKRFLKDSGSTEVALSPSYRETANMWCNVIYSVARSPKEMATMARGFFNNSGSYANMNKYMDEFFGVPGAEGGDDYLRKFWGPVGAVITSANIAPGNYEQGLNVITDTWKYYEDVLGPWEPEIENLVTEEIAKALWQQ